MALVSPDTGRLAYAAMYSRAPASRRPAQPPSADVAARDDTSNRPPSENPPPSPVSAASFSPSDSEGSQSDDSTVLRRRRRLGSRGAPSRVKAPAVGASARGTPAAARKPAPPLASTLRAGQLGAGGGGGVGLPPRRPVMTVTAGADGDSVVSAGFASAPAAAAAAAAGGGSGGAADALAVPATPAATASARGKAGGGGGSGWRPSFALLSSPAVPVLSSTPVQPPYPGRSSGGDGTSTPSTPVAAARGASVSGVGGAATGLAWAEEGGTGAYRTGGGGARSAASVAGGGGGAHAAAVAGVAPDGTPAATARLLPPAAVGLRLGDPARPSVTHITALPVPPQWESLMRRTDAALAAAAGKSSPGEPEAYVGVVEGGTATPSEAHPASPLAAEAGALFAQRQLQTARPQLALPVSLDVADAASAAAAAQPLPPARPRVSSANMTRAAALFAGHDPSRRIPGAVQRQRGFFGSWGASLGLTPLTSTLTAMRAVVSQKKRRFREGDFDLDLTYITPRLIAMGFPSSGSEGLYRNPMAEVQRFFETRHAGRYRVYNLCTERSYDAAEFLGRVARFPFDDHNPPPLEMLPVICADIDAWLAEHPDNVAAVHCKAGKGRTGLVLGAYILHCGLRPTADSALRFYGGARTANGKGVTIPSQMRWVAYYEQMLRHGAPPVHTYRVTHVRLRTVPSVELGSGGCTPFFELRCDGVKVFDFKKAVARQQRDWEQSVRAATATARATAAAAATAAAVAASGDPSLSVLPLPAAAGAGGGGSVASPAAAAVVAAATRWRSPSVTSGMGWAGGGGAGAAPATSATAGILLSSGDDSALRAAGSGGAAAAAAGLGLAPGGEGAGGGAGAGAATAGGAASDVTSLRRAAEAAAAAAADAEAEAAAMLSQGGPPSSLRLRRYRRGEPFVDFDLTSLDVRVRGNVKLQLLHESLGGGAAKLAHLWFHTGFVARNYLFFGRPAIDKAGQARKFTTFAPGFGIELYLTRVSDSGGNGGPAAPEEKGGAAGGGGRSAARSIDGTPAAAVASGAGGGGSVTPTHAGDTGTATGRPSSLRGLSPFTLLYPGAAAAGAGGPSSSPPPVPPLLLTPRPPRPARSSVSGVLAQAAPPQHPLAATLPAHRQALSLPAPARDTRALERSDGGKPSGAPATAV